MIVPLSGRAHSFARFARTFVDAYDNATTLMMVLFASNTSAPVDQSTMDTLHTMRQLYGANVIQWTLIRDKPFSRGVALTTGMSVNEI
jgi:hypothetical protein